MDFSSRLNRVIRGSPKTVFVNCWKEPAANTSPLCTRTEYVAWLPGDFCFVRDRDPRGAWISRAEKHRPADRGFTGYGAPDEGSCASTARSFCGWARVTSACRGLVADCLSVAKYRTRACKL